MSIGNATKGFVTYGCFHPCFFISEWMETRKKLQAQLDVLLTRTTNKISNIATKPEGDYQLIYLCITLLL